jgi:hypothetical protein
MLQVVDPLSRLRVDVFQDRTGSLGKARPFPALYEGLLVLDARSLLDYKLQLLSKASAEHPVDSKHYLDALALARLFHHEVPPIPPAHLGQDVYCTNLDMLCQRCAASADEAFPLSPKRRIFDLLGYV